MSTDPKIDRYIARGRTITGRKLRGAIKAAAGEVIGGRGIVVSSINGRTVVSLKGHPIIPKVKGGTFFAELSTAVLLTPNVWLYEWFEVEPTLVIGEWQVLVGGRRFDVPPGQHALNLRERGNTEDNAAGIDLPSLPGDVEVLPATIGLGTRVVPMYEATKPDGTFTYWINESTQFQPSCPPQPVLPPPPIIEDVS